MNNEEQKQVSHSRGPWGIGGGAAWNRVYDSSAPRKTELALVNPLLEESVANAKLIAAAPLLLESLLKVRQMIAIKDGKATLNTSPEFVEQFIDNTILKATK